MATKEDRRLAAIQKAYERRSVRTQKEKQEFEWFGDKIQKGMGLSFRQRVEVATHFLRDKVVKNISKPVKKVKTKHGVRVTERSKPGEFPRADTTLLMKTIFAEVEEVKPNIEIYGYVGTPLDYGFILETRMNRSFLVRTLNENMIAVQKILSRTLESDIS